MHLKMMERWGANVNVEAGSDGCWLWTASGTPDGYGQFGIDGRYWYAHRAAWELFRFPITRGLCVLHSCDNPPCCNPNHLFLGTHADNAADRDRKCRLAPPRGSLNGNSKLSEAQVVEIRAAAANGSNQATIAARFGIRQPLVSKIVAGKMWTHVEPPVVD